MSDTALKNYSIGLDIGIASVGWAVLDWDRNKIADLGVRLFPCAENPKDGSSLALPRREARSARRRTRRKRQRLADIRNLIEKNKIVSAKQLETLFEKTPDTTPWQLRLEGLDRKLSAEEWARVLLHIAKRRGFKSNRLDDLSKDEETGRATEGMKANSALLANYRTIGEMLAKDEKFAEHKRNKGGNYTNTIARDDLKKEIETLFDCQRKFGSSFATPEFEKEYTGIFARQLPFASGEILEKMTGFCSLEYSEKRAPKASWTAERFILLSKIANLKVRVNGKKYELSPEERKTIENLAYKLQKVTYKQIRKAIASDDDWQFDYIAGAKKGSDPETAVFAELKAFHQFRKAVCEKLCEEYWNVLLETSPQTLDILAFALTYRKTEEEIREYLTDRNVDEKLISAVCGLNFSGNVNLSVKAMDKLIPLLEKGLRYDEARVAAGYGAKNAEERSRKLPVPDWEEIRNPVVIRAVSQTRKMLNAIIEKYGSPAEIHIELARDLSRSKKERNEIAKNMENNRAANQKYADEFTEQFNNKPTAEQREKYRLWKEQGGYCPYTGKYMEPALVFCNPKDGSYAEIDHIIPYSRSFDDSRTNKVLVIGSANRNKGNKTPYEYFGKEGQAWEEFTARVDMYIKDRRKAQRLKMKNFDETEANDLTERSLGDTRYITRYLANLLEDRLVFADNGRKQHVIRINGMATATLRKQWGINALKNRAESDLHHALDACVIAAASPSMIKKISDYSKMKELCKLQTTPEGKKERLPEPWKNFRKEIEARLSDKPAELLAEYGFNSYTEEELQTLKPVFISRKPDRKAGGAAHEETIRSAKYLAQGKTAVKTPLAKINLKTLEDMVGKERDTALYNAIKERLLAFNNKPEKAFAEPLIKPSKNGNGSVVRSINILSSGTAGVKINKGLAANGGMVRVDVYEKEGKYYLIPYYVADIADRTVKNRAIVANKPQNEWTLIDGSYKFKFALYSNDLVKVVTKSGEEIFGYYKGTSISTSAITIGAANGEWERPSIGVKTAVEFEKYEVDLFGNYYKTSK